MGLRVMFNKAWQGQIKTHQAEMRHWRRNGTRQMDTDAMEQEIKSKKWQQRLDMMWTGQIWIHCLSFKSRGNEKQTKWWEGNCDERFRAEQRFTVSLRFKLSIGSQCTNNTKAASSLFSLRQHSPSAPVMDSHARSQLWGTCFVIDGQA